MQIINELTLSKDIIKLYETINGCVLFPRDQTMDGHKFP